MSRKNNYEVTPEDRLNVFKQMIERGRVFFENDDQTNENADFATISALYDDGLVESCGDGWYQLSNGGQSSAIRSGLMQFADYTPLTIS